MNDAWKRMGIALAVASVLAFSSGCDTVETRKDEVSAQESNKASKKTDATKAEAEAETAGVEVGELSSIRTMVSAEELNASAQQQYNALLRSARSQGALVPASDAQAKRLDGIAKRIIPFAKRFNPEAEKWEWEINLIRSKDVNAFCMPGGKIAFYTGLNDTLKATDDELAIVMGHEIAHALREHSRAQIAKSKVTSIGATLLGQIVGGGQYAKIFDFADSLLNLKFSRDDENEADLVGLELAARAGYDPHAGISLWNKMAESSSGSSASWFSTHPSSSSRAEEIEANLPKVMPLYEMAKAKPKPDVKKNLTKKNTTKKKLTKPAKK